MSGNSLRLDTVLPWERVTRWRYHLEKLLQSGGIGFALFCVTPLPLVWAMVAGALGYLVIGKLTLGRTHHPSAGLELMDWIADLIIGLAGTAIAVWSAHGLALGLVAVGVWAVLYAGVSYRWAIP